MTELESAEPKLGDEFYKDPETLEYLYWDEQLAMIDIAKLADVSMKTIYNWMNKFEIDRRSNAESTRLRQGYKYPHYTVSTNGYPAWIYKYEGKGYKVPVSRLLAVAEYGFDAVKDNHAHHKNGVKWDNRPDNIEVKTATDHLRDHQLGEGNTNNKLSEKEVREIKRRAESGEKHENIAEDVGCSRATVSDIYRGNSWSHLFDG